MEATIKDKETNKNYTISLLTGQLTETKQAAATKPVNHGTQKQNGAGHQQQAPKASVEIDDKIIIGSFPGTRDLAKYTADGTWKVSEEPSISNSFVATIVHVQTNLIGIFDLKTCLLQWTKDQYVAPPPQTTPIKVAVNGPINPKKTPKSKNKKKTLNCKQNIFSFFDSSDKLP